MAVPKRKTSVSKKKMRRSHHKLSSANIVEDKKSGEYKNKPKPVPTPRAAFAARGSWSRSATPVRPAATRAAHTATLEVYGTWTMRLVMHTTPRGPKSEKKGRNRDISLL